MIKFLNLSELELAFLNNLPWGVVVMELTDPGDDLSLTLVSINPLGTELLNVQEKEVVGRNVDRIFPGLTNVGVFAKCAEIARSGKPVSFSDIFYGDARISATWFSARGFHLGNRCVALCLEDVSERKKAEEEGFAQIRRLEEKLDSGAGSARRISMIAREWTTTFDAIPDYVAIVEKDFRIRRMNRAMAKCLGAEPADLVGRKCHEVLHGLDHTIKSCPAIDAIQKGGTFSSEIHDPNIGIPLRVTCSPFRDDNGEIIGVVHVARDISVERKAYAEKEHLIAELQQSIANARMLRGFLPICSCCKKIRNDKGYWQQIETYIRDHSEAEFSHGVCPDCIKTLYPDLNHDDER